MAIRRRWATAIENCEFVTYPLNLGQFECPSFIVMAFQVSVIFTLYFIVYDSDLGV